MPRKGRSNEEIIHALHQVEGGEKVTEVCRRLGVSEQTFYRWKKQFSGLGLQELRELRSLRHENAKLKQVVADLTLDRHILQEVVRKKCMVRPRSASETPALRCSPRQCIRPVGGACPLLAMMGSRPDLS
jgi:putative transposase